MLSSILLIVASIVSIVAAQNYTTNGPLNVTASQIPLVQRTVWCDSQLTICRALCSDDLSSNLCDPDVLSYSCVCSNGPTPNISNYKETLPFYICLEWVANCVDNHPNDLRGITACRSVQCGTKNATTEANSGGSASSASGSQPTNTASSTTSGNMAAATFAASYGTHLMAGGMLVAFGLAL